MVGVAVKVNDEPAQVGLVPDVSAMDTAGVTALLTVIVILFDEIVAVPPPIVKVMFGL